MTASLRYWWPLLVSGSLASSAAILGGWQATVICAGSLALGCRMTARRFDRHRRQATAQIQQSTSSPLTARRDTYFDALIAAAESQMADLKTTAEEAESRSAQAEARVHLTRRDFSRVQMALSTLPVPTVLLDADGVVFIANAAAGETLPEARPGEPLPSDGPVAVLTEAVRQVRARGDQAEDQVRELSLPTVTRGPAADPSTQSSSDGPTVPELAPSDEPPVRSYQATIRPLRGTTQAAGASRLIGTVVSLEETTDRDTIKQQCAQFLGAACHELKTPMASIRAHVELLADGDLETPEEQAESLQFIDEQADRLSRLVENMLNLSRIQSGLVRVSRRDTSLSDVLRKSYDVLETAAAKKSIRLVDEISDLYMAVNVDTDLFGQAITNLVSNAVKYTPEGGEVRLRSRLDERHAVIDVQDNGLGIPEESLPRIFDRFYRVPENNHSAPGTGLGLALVQFVAEDIHGGEIGVSSTVGEGSTFSIRLPLGHRDTRRRVVETAAAS